MSLQTYEVIFNNKNYCINEINDLIEEITKYIPENSCSSIKKCINNLFLNNLRPSKKNFKDRFDGHLSSGSNGKKSLSFFCKVKENNIYIIILGCHKFEKQRKNKKFSQSSTYKVLYQTPEDKNNFGQGDIVII